MKLNSIAKGEQMIEYQYWKNTIGNLECDGCGRVIGQGNMCYISEETAYCEDCAMFLETKGDVIFSEKE